MIQKLLITSFLLSLMGVIGCGKRELPPASRGISGQSNSTGSQSNATVSQSNTTTTDPFGQSGVGQTDTGAGNAGENKAALAVSQFQMTSPLECCAFKDSKIFIRQCLDFDPLACNRVVR